MSAEVEELFSRLRYFGVFPYRGPGLVVCPRLALVSACLCAAVLTTAAWLALRGPLLTAGSASPLLYQVLFYLRQSVKLLPFPFSLWTTLAGRGNLTALLLDLSRLRGQMSEAGLHPADCPHEKLRLQLAGLLLAFLSVFLPLVLVNDSPLSVPQGVLTFSAMTAVMGLTHMVESSVSLLAAHFSTIRLALVYGRLSRLRGAPFLEKLTHFHSALCTLSLRLDKLFQLPITFVVGVSFLMCVIYVYYIVFLCTTAMGSSKVLLVSLLTHYFAVASISFLFVESIVASATLLSNQARLFNLSLYQLMMDDCTDHLCTNKTLRLHILMKQDVAFTACGFFNVDYALIQSMVSAATTYLVILVQFGRMASGKPAGMEVSTIILPAVALP